MARYIDADLLLEELEDTTPINWTDSEVEIQRDFDWKVFKHMVGYQTVVDAVEVVRCKDCGHKGAAFCMAGDFPLTKENENAFCSYGEREEV